MNLLSDPWIPVRTRGDEGRWIAPWQITEELGADPIVAIDAPRADFTGALMQFLIGLLQTAVAPENVQDWEQRFRNPPAPDTLREAIMKFEDCFDFGPERPSFMEDLELEDTADKPINGLLIDAPGGNTLKENKDFFVKRGSVRKLCPEVAAMALLTLQINAPSGGVGHRTSLRGGGPLTALVVNTPRGAFDTLWHNLWLNVLTRPRFEGLSGDASLLDLGARFPWTAPSRVSDKHGVNTTPQDAHPLTLYWAMPRRIRLDWENTTSGACDITGRYSDQLLTGFATRNYGANYEGAWRHPLSPYHENANSAPSAQHPQPGGIHYRHWLGLATSRQGQSRPAAVVDAWRDAYRRSDPLRSQVPHLWAFGYDMDNMKARCWYESLMPLHYVRTDAERFQHRVGAFTEAAELIGNYVNSGLRQAWFKRPGDAKGDTRFLREAFWQTTESDFYEQLAALAHAIDTIADEDALDDALYDIASSWLQVLQRAARRMFDQWAANGYFEAENPARISVAHNDLEKKLNGRKLRQALGLPEKRQAA